MPPPSELDIDLLRRKVRVICETLTAGLGKVGRRYVEDMLRGMLIGGSVRLTAIARALDESIPLHATHKRLSRNLGNSRTGQTVADNLLRAGAGLVRDDSLLVVDVFELVKQHARKMEYLGAPVSQPDASSAPGQSRRSSDRGYQVCEIFGWDIDGGPMPGLPDAITEQASATGGDEDLSAWNNFVLTPLAQALFSANAPGFRSAPDEIVKLVRRVDAACEGRAVFALDTVGLPGLPRPGLPRHTPHLLGMQRDLPEALARETNCRYAVRVPGDYPLLRGRSRMTAHEVGLSCETPYGLTLYKHRDDNDLGMFTHFGAVPVRLPGHPEKSLWLLAVKGLSDGDATLNDWDPVLIVTTEPMRRNREVLWHLVWAFLSFWDAIRTNQGLKEQFDFDDIRVLSYDRLRNLGSLVVAASFVEAQWPGIAFRKSLFRTPRSRSHTLLRVTAPDEREQSRLSA